MTKRTKHNVPELTVAVNIPLRLLRTREKLTRQLWLKFSSAMKDRERYCKQNNIAYLGECYSKPAPDEVYDTLGRLTTHYYVENLKLNMLISKLHHIVYKATNGETFGHEYNGAVSEVIGKRSIASLII